MLFFRKRNEHKLPRYMTYSTYSQNTNLSIVTKDGIYDMNNFSDHETNTIVHVLSAVRLNYPEKYKSMGLVNESYQILYKARYVLYEIVIQVYSNSKSYIDQMAVAIAYQSKGTHFRAKAIEYFEKSVNHVKPDFLSEFVCCQPARIYDIFSKAYEGEHNYDKAIHYTKLAKKYSVPGNTYYVKRLQELKQKQDKNTKKRNIKMKEQQIEFEKGVTEAAQTFLRYL